MKRCDVAVVGAGPAGAMAAHALARRGLDVTLLEKATMPRFKVCGCCLNADALALLERAGMAAPVAALGGPRLARMEVAAEGRRAAVALPPGRAISRSALDAALAGQARDAGARLLEGTTARWRESRPGGHRLALHAPRSTHAGDHLDARLVLVADGVAGRFLKAVPGFESETRPGARMGLATTLAAPGAPYGAGTVFMGCGRRGYCGLVRLETGALAVAAAADADFVRQQGGPGPAAERLLADAGLPAVPGLATAEWRGTPGLTRAWRPLAQPRMFVVGDAAGYVEPFTGEGMAWALASGEAVTDAAVDAIEGDDSAAAERWARERQRLLAGRQRRCAWIARGLRRPAVVRGGVRLAASWPRLATALGARISGPHRALGASARAAGGVGPR